MTKPSTKRSLLRSAVRGFAAGRADARGNIGMMTSLLAGALLIGVGAAVDFSGVSKRSNDLQNFSDAAVLAAAKARNADDDEMRTIVEQVVAQHNTQGWPLDVEVLISDEDIVVNLATDYDTMLMGFVGKKTMPVAVDSKSLRARLTPIDLAIVVDTTDSMQGTNIAALRTAAAALVDEMQALEAPTRLSLVPFGQYVNVGVAGGTPGMRNWLDMGRYGETYEHCWIPKEVVTPQDCDDLPTIRRDIVVDGRVMGQEDYTPKSCTGGEWRDLPERCEDRTYGWNGCMGSRKDDLAFDPDMGSTRLPAALDETCGSEIVPLTSNPAAIRSAISTLDTKGPTYLPSGLMWGWRTLDSDAPLTEAAAPHVRTPGSPATTRVKRAMLFMTDGLNSRSAGSDSPGTTGVKHNSTDKDKALKATEDACDAINAAQVELFVVAYQLPDADATEEVLAACATTPGHYFTPESASELVESFREVATMMDYTILTY